MAQAWAPGAAPHPSQAHGPAGAEEKGEREPVSSPSACRCRRCCCSPSPPTGTHPPPARAPPSRQALLLPAAPCYGKLIARAAGRQRCASHVGLVPSSPLFGDKEAKIPLGGGTWRKEGSQQGGHRPQCVGDHQKGMRKSKTK